VPPGSTWLTAPADGRPILTSPRNGKNDRPRRMSGNGSLATFAGRRPLGNTRRSARPAVPRLINPRFKSPHESLPVSHQRGARLHAANTQRPRPSRFRRTLGSAAMLAARHRMRSYVSTCVRDISRAACSLRLSEPSVSPKGEARSGKIATYFRHLR
jgi:hypothetical protein